MRKNYKFVRNPSHPNSYGTGFMYEHVLVASENLGRPLKKGECVHHVDNNHLNNSPENLIVFRTNSDHIKFHMGGELVKHDDGTYSCKSVKKSKTYKYYFCNECGNKCTQKYNLCIDCYKEIKSEHLPSKEYLKELIWSAPTTHVAKLFNVSDKAVEKWCKKYNIEKPPRGYWQKLHNGKSYADISISG